MSRNRFDRAAKDMLRASLEPDGVFESDAEVSPEIQRLDGWFVPDPALPPTRKGLGLLGRLTEDACGLEPFHCTPSSDEVEACIRKLLNFRHVLSLRRPPPSPPHLRIISSGRPETALVGFGFQPAEGWPSGVYWVAPLFFTGLVVLSELPRTRDTLLLRLMAAGRCLQEAIAELAQLPRDARETGIARPILLRYRLEVPKDPAQRTREDEEYLMSTLDIVAEWEREKEAVGVRKGLKEGLKIGLKKGLITTYEIRFGAIPQDLAALIHKARDETTLEEWYELIRTSSAEEFAAALRSAR